MGGVTRKSVGSPAGRAVARKAAETGVVSEHDDRPNVKLHTHSGPPPAAAAALLALVLARACLAEASPPVFQFHAFGSLALSHSSENQADFLGSLLIRHGAGYTQSWSAEVDSRLGAQLAVTLTPKISAVVQVLAEQGHDGGYTPRMEWANVTYHPTTDASVRVGRIVLPTFMVSDSRKVGYANAWVRPPGEVYGLVPITSNDGVDATYRAHIGTRELTLQGIYGQSDTKIPSGGTAQAREVWGVTATAENGPGQLRVAYEQTRLTIDVYNRLFDGFRQFGPEGLAIARRFDADGSVLQFVGAGGLYDPGNWFVMAELGLMRSPSAVGEHVAWYASGGYRFGALTPYVSYSAIAARSPRSDPGLTAAAYPPAQAGAVASLNAALDRLLAASVVQNTISLGVRWDFRKNFDCKLQLDRSRRGAGSPGTLGNIQPGFRPGGRYEVVSLAVDFVY